MLDFTHLGITDQQARDLIKLAAAACASAAWEEPNPLTWALDYFDDPEGLVEAGRDVWEAIDDKYRSV